MISSKLDANQIQKLSFDEAEKAVRTLGVGGKLVPEVYDQILLSYDGAGNIGTVVYMHEGQTAAQLTLIYDGSNRLIQVSRM